MSALTKSSCLAKEVPGNLLESLDMNPETFPSVVRAFVFASTLTAKKMSEISAAQRTSYIVARQVSVNRYVSATVPRLCFTGPA